MRKRKLPDPCLAFMHCLSSCTLSFFVGQILEVKTISDETPRDLQVVRGLPSARPAPSPLNPELSGQDCR